MKVIEIDCSLLDLLFHPLHDLFLVGEHPNTEDELVLDLEGDLPTVQNIQDPREHKNEIYMYM